MNNNVMCFLKEVLRDDELTTSQIESILKDKFDYHCPDSFARTLQVFKGRGIVDNRMNEQGEVVWFLM